MFMYLRTSYEVKSPQANGTCERVHQMILNEFYLEKGLARVHYYLERGRIQMQEVFSSIIAESLHGIARMLTVDSPNPYR